MTGACTAMDYQIVTSLPDQQTMLAWNECLDNCEFAGHYTAPELFRELYFAGRQPFAILAVSKGVVDGLVTGLVEGGRLTCGAPGSPHLCMRSGANPDDVGKALAVGLRAHASRSADFISLFSWTEVSGLGSGGFRVRTLGVPLCTILLDLSKGADALFRDCSETRRNKIRRAIRAKVEVSEMNVAQDFDKYYELYGDWCSFKGIQRQPYDTQRAVFESTGNRLCLVARHEGEIVGVSTFRHRRPGIIEYAANVSRREETKTRQNDLLLWRGIEWAVHQGDLRYFSMAGAHFFLQKFGGCAHVTYGYTLDRTFFRRHHGAQTAFAAMTRAYRALPEGVRRTLKKLVRRDGGRD